MKIKNISAIVTDIEGTTSSIDFVYDVLFPYASKNLAGYISAHESDIEIGQILKEAREIAAEPHADIQRTIEILLEWIAADQKITPLKTLQGKIWRQGFESGELSGHMYPDVVTNLQQWSQAGIDLYVYSSGSVEAQKLLFGYSDVGDLRSLIAEYFDTRTGHKRESKSYVSIANAIGRPTAEILFLSDVAEELDAAAGAGMQTIQLIRDDRAVPGEHIIVNDFDHIDI